jgi:putative hydrolase of the HAD superfamily
MKNKNGIRCLFLDIGGVLLTDGWPAEFRASAASKFNLNLEEMEKRHYLALDTYEEGKLTLDEYLQLVVFYKPRTFSNAQFRNFMFTRSESYPKMIDLMRRLKKKYNLKIVVVSNEGRELNAYRIDKFKLDVFVDYFISSCYVHLRKPDPEIYQMALDTAQLPISQIIYIENIRMFVRTAKKLGIKSILHTDYESTSLKLASLGLKAD